VIDKKLPPERLLWLDLELTGIDVETDIILEVAALVSDFNFVNLAEYQAAVSQNQAEVRELMNANAWWQNFPQTRQQLLDEVKNGKPLITIEDELIRLIDEQFKGKPAVLAGNSIHNDRSFIKKYLPRLEAKLHYRMLDVSSFKVLMQAKYGVTIDKPEIHRAKSDIQASIEELKYYLKWFKDGSTDS